MDNKDMDLLQKDAVHWGFSRLCDPHTPGQDDHPSCTGWLRPAGRCKCPCHVWEES